MGLELGKISSSVLEDWSSSFFFRLEFSDTPPIIRNMSHSFFVGVDPGADGGVCIMTPSGEILDLFPMPTSQGATKREVEAIEIEARVDLVATDLLFNSTEDAAIPFVAIEKVGPFPGSSATGAFTFGRNFEAVVTWCKILSYPFELVDPKRWQKEILAGTAKGKDAVLSWARKSFPDRAALLGKHDGMGDAVAICEFIRRLKT